MNKIFIMFLLFTNLIFANNIESNSLLQKIKDSMNSFPYPTEFALIDNTKIDIGENEIVSITNGKNECNIFMYKKMCTLFKFKNNYKFEVSFIQNNEIKNEIWEVKYLNNAINIYRENGKNIKIIKF